MKTDRAIEHFGSVRKVADALGILPAAVYQWGEDVPELSARRLEDVTGCELRYVRPAKWRQKRAAA